MKIITTERSSLLASTSSLSIGRFCIKFQTLDEKVDGRFDGRFDGMLDACLMECSMNCSNIECLMDALSMLGERKFRWNNQWNSLECSINGMRECPIDKMFDGEMLD